MKESTNFLKKARPFNLREPAGFFTAVLLLPISRKLSSYFLFWDEKIMGIRAT